MSTAIRLNIVSTFVEFLADVSIYSIPSDFANSYSMREMTSHSHTRATHTNINIYICWAHTEECRETYTVDPYAWHSMETN